MALRDSIIHKYVVTSPTSGNLFGFDKDSIIYLRKLFNGIDLNLSSKWTISRIKNGKLSVNPLDAPSIWSKRISDTSLIRTYFTNNAT